MSAATKHSNRFAIFSERIVVKLPERGFHPKCYGKSPISFLEMDSGWFPSNRFWLTSLCRLHTETDEIFPPAHPCGTLSVQVSHLGSASEVIIWLVVKWDRNELDYRKKRKGRGEGWRRADTECRRVRGSSAWAGGRYLRWRPRLPQPRPLRPSPRLWTSMLCFCCFFCCFFFHGQSGNCISLVLLVYWLTLNGLTVASDWNPISQIKTRN